MKFLISLAIALTSFGAHASQYSAFGGINSTEYKGGPGWNREFGWEFGASYVMPIQTDLFFRSGAGVVQKASEMKVADKRFEYLFMEIPATVMYSLNPHLRVFGGLNFDITLADDGDKSESFAVALPLGVRYNWGTPSSLEAILEFGLTDIDKGNIDIGNSFSVRYLYDFTWQWH